MNSRTQLSTSSLTDNGGDGGAETATVTEGDNPSGEVTVKQKQGHTTINSTRSSRPPASKKRPRTMEKSVQEMGRKARIRLEEEKSKRKEIVRLTDIDIHKAAEIIPLDAKTSTRTRTSRSINTKRQKGFNFQKPGNSSRTIAKRRRKATISITTSASASASTTNMQSRSSLKDSKHCDTYSPNIQSASVLKLPKAEKSQFLRIHGLPLGAMVDSIYQFFVGLSPECVIVLPSLNIPIAGFDIDIISSTSTTTTTTCTSTRKGKEKVAKVPTIQRYPETFRVFVKFQSPMVAEAAIRRSGELMNHTATCTVNDSDYRQKKKVAISLSPVPKIFAKALFEHELNIECKRSTITTTSVEGALKEVEDQMPPVINQILWLKALNTLRLKYPLEAIGIGIGMGIEEIGDSNNMESNDNCGQISIRVRDIEHISPTSRNNKGGYSSSSSKNLLVALHNKLFDMHEEICKQCAPFQCEEIDPILTSMNPSFRLTTIAVSWLIDHMEMIQKCLISSAEL